MTAEELAGLVAAWLSGDEGSHVPLADALEEHGHPSHAHEVREDRIVRWGEPPLRTNALLVDLLHLGTVEGVQAAAHLANHIVTGLGVHTAPGDGWDLLLAAADHVDLPRLRDLAAGVRARHRQHKAEGVRLACLLLLTVQRHAAVWIEEQMEGPAAPAPGQPAAAQEVEHPEHDVPF